MSQDAVVQGRHVATIRVKDKDCNKGLAVSEDGTTLAVSNDATHRITLYTMRTGEEIRGFGGKGSGRGQFNFPWHVCFSNSDKQLLVADTENHRVQEVTRTGEYVRSFGVGDLGLVGGLALKDNRLLVSHWGKPQRLTLFDYTTGCKLQSFGEESVLQFNRGVCFSPDRGHGLFVANNGGNNVLKFSPDGTFKYAFGDRSTLKHPVAVSTSVLTSDTYNVFVGGQCSTEIAVFRHTGDGVCKYLTSFGGSALFSWASAVVVSHGRLFVLDRSSDRVQVFE